MTKRLKIPKRQSEVVNRRTDNTMTKSCIVCPSIYYFWLPLWYLQTFGLCIVCPSIFYFWLPPLVSSNCWPLYRLSLYLLLLITSFGIFKLLAIVSCVLLFTTSDYLFDIFKLLAIVSSVLLFTISDYLFCYFQPFGLLRTHDTMAKSLKTPKEVIRSSK
jgi:hypothetical protein